jgi:gluconokinase
MIVIVMGVTGAGKTTIGQLLAEHLGWQFADADDFHPAANVEKMRRGIPLTDDDRWPWLDRLHAEIESWIADGRNAVLACSALKQSYRARLDAGLEAAREVRFVYLKGSPALIAERLRERHGHFAGEAILAGQFADLEEPAAGDKDVITVDIDATPEEIVAEIRTRLD